MHNGPPPYGAPPPHPGYGPPPNHPPPYGYGQPAHETWVNPNRVGVTEIIAPLLLSIFFCGIGGYAWGFYKLIQGHNKPGWVAMGINFAVWILGFVFWAHARGHWRGSKPALTRKHLLHCGDRPRVAGDENHGVGWQVWV
jgi:hypothetical protein